MLFLIINNVTCALVFLFNNYKRFVIIDSGVLIIIDVMSVFIIMDNLSSK